MTQIMFDRRHLTKAGADNIFAWCDQTFGKNAWAWDHHWPESYCFFNFKDEKHAAFFLLKWKIN